MPRQTEEARVREAVAGMPASQALKYLAEILRPGSSPARCIAVSEMMQQIAATLDTQQALVRDGLPVDSQPDTAVTIREYAVRSTHPDGTTALVTYGDRLYTAASDAMRVPDGHVLQRNVIVGPWTDGPELPETRGPWWPGVA